MPLKTCPNFRSRLKLQELLCRETGAAPAGERVPVRVGGGEGGVLMGGLVVVVVELGEADEEDGGEAEGEDEDGRHQQLGTMLLQSGR